LGHCFSVVSVFGYVSKERGCFIQLLGEFFNQIVGVDEYAADVFFGVVFEGAGEFF
jgi:hypothetical protein